MSKIKVTVWNEFVHEKESEEVRAVYPEGIHEAIASYLNNDVQLKVITASLDQPEHGLTDKVLKNTDVLIWWGHKAHDKVDDAVADRVCEYVHKGMGFIALHSAHMAKPFKKLMGTSCTLCWREIGERERVWNIAPAHPITEGIGDYFELEHEEMYGERFDVPEPDELVFISWFQGGEVFRSGCCYKRGLGRVFYFQPGHETYPTYHDQNVIKVINNAVKWAYNPYKSENVYCPHVAKSIENIAD